MAPITHYRTKNSTKQQIDYPFCPSPPICLLFRYYLFATYHRTNIRSDLLFHEATFAQSEQARAKETFHTTASQAGEIARTAKVKQLLIGHFSARYEDESILLQEASDIFPNTLLARETLKISIESIKP